MLDTNFGRIRHGTLALVLTVGTAFAQATAPLNQTPDGLAMDGFDVVAYFTDGAPAKGLPEHAVEHEGARWLFASAEHADLFRADPAKHSPRHNGWCSCAVSEGYAAEVDFVNCWAVIDGALDLNWDGSVRETFLAEQDKRIPAAETNWPSVEAGLADGSATFCRHADDPSVGISHSQALN